jgi:hypothetical protein
MSKTDQFQQYAEEALRWARQSKTEKEKQAYTDLALTWMQAAVQSEHIFGVNDSAPEAQGSVRPASVAVSQASSTLSFPKIISAHSDGAARKELTW